MPERLTLAILALFLSGCFSLPVPELTEEERARMDEFLYEVDGDSNRALRSGDDTDPRVIFVHGSPGNAEGWSDYLVPPIEGAECIAIDRPGYGGSDHGLAESLAEQAAAIVPLLEERQGRWPILVGHSLGGPIVARVAADHPDRVGGIVIVAGSVSPELERLRWYNYLAKGLAWVIPKDLRRSNQEMWDLREELEGLEQDLDRVVCPVWVVHGEQDALVPIGNVPFLEEALPNAAELHVKRYPESGHFLIWSAAEKDELRELISGALRRP